MRRLSLGLGGLAGFLILWELAGLSGVLDPSLVPEPTSVLGRLGGLFADPGFRAAVVATVLAWLLALGITVVIAVPLGLLLGSVPVLRGVTSAVIDFLRPIPAVALTPLCVVSLGAGPATKILLAVLAGTWPILFNVLYGLRDVDPLQLAAARSFRTPAWRVAALVRFPAVVPFALTGFRVALGLELIVIVSTEFLAGTGYPGIGAYVWNAGQQTGDLTTVLAGTMVAGLLGYLANLLLVAVTRRWFSGRPGTTAGGTEDLSAKRWPTVLGRWGVLLGCVVVWQVVTTAVGSPFAPAPLRIANAAYHLWLTGPAAHLGLSSAALGNILPSIGRLAAGFAIAVVAGIAIGVAFGRAPRLADTVEPLLAFGRSVPASLLIPVLFVLLHAGAEMEIATIAMGAIWPVVLNTMDGVRTVEPVILGTARAFGTPGPRLLLTVVLPAASDKIMAGLRVSLSLSLIVMVVSELVGASNGIGYQLSQTQATFDYPQMWAYIALISVLGYVLNRLLLFGERHLMHWHDTAHS